MGFPLVRKSMALNDLERRSKLLFNNSVSVAHSFAMFAPSKRFSTYGRFNGVAAIFVT